MKIPFLEKKKSKTGGVVVRHLLGKPAWTPRLYDELARESYQFNPIAYRAVKLKSEAVAMLPWRAKIGDEIVDKHIMLDLLFDPNPEQTGCDLLESLSSYLDIAGNAYLEIVMSGDRKELYSLRPDRVRLLPNKKGFAGSYEYTAGSEKTTFLMKLGKNEQQPLIHIKAFHPTNDFYGMSCVEPGAFAIDIHNQASSFAKALLDNSARPSGALVYEGEEGERNLSDDQFERLKAQLKEEFSGPKNSGNPLLLDGAMKWIEMAISPRELDYVEGKREAAREIALAFGVPPMLMGIPGDNTYSNYVEANRAFFRQTVLPQADRIAASITKFLKPSFGDVDLTYDIDQIPALVQEREAHWKRVASANYLTNEEKRSEVNYPPIGDERDNELSPTSSDGRGDRGNDRQDRDPAVVE